MPTRLQNGEVNSNYWHMPANNLALPTRVSKKNGPGAAINGRTAPPITTRMDDGPLWAPFTEHLQASFADNFLLLSLAVQSAFFQKHSQQLLES